MINFGNKIKKINSCQEYQIYYQKSMFEMVYLKYMEKLFKNKIENIILNNFNYHNLCLFNPLFLASS